MDVSLSVAVAPAAGLQSTSGAPPELLDALVLDEDEEALVDEEVVEELDEELLDVLPPMPPPLDEDAVLEVVAPPAPPWLVVDDVLDVVPEPPWLDDVEVSLDVPLPPAPPFEVEEEGGVVPSPPQARGEASRSESVEAKSDRVRMKRAYRRTRRARVGTLAPCQSRSKSHVRRIVRWPIARSAWASS